VFTLWLGYVTPVTFKYVARYLHMMFTLPLQDFCFVPSGGID